MSFDEIQNRSDGSALPPNSSESWNHRRISDLEWELARAAAEIAGLRSALKRTQYRLAKQEKEHAAFVQMQTLLDDLRDRIADRDEHLTWLEAHAEQQKEGIEWLRQELAARDTELDGIHRSRWWRLAVVYWNVHAWFGRMRRLLGIGRSARPAPAAASRTEAAQPAPCPTTYDIICFSIIDWNFRWQRPQQMMSRFADEGHRVFFLSTSRFVQPSAQSYDARQIRPNVWEIALASPAIDVYGGNSARHTNAILASLAAVRRDFNISCGVSVVQVATWTAAALAARERFGWQVAYDCMDEWDTFPGIGRSALAEEKRLVDDADVVIVSARRLLEKWEHANRNVVLARNAADFERFFGAERKNLFPSMRRPVIGYFGAIADWFDLDLVVQLAKARPHYSFVLVGGAYDVSVDRLSSLPNVRLEGNQPYERIPSYLREFDVCIIPFKVNAVTQATDPVKFYEYISQGKPVVSTRMAELLPYGDCLYMADDADDFIDKVDRAVAERDPALVERRIELARANRWQERTALIKAVFADSHPKVSIVVVTYHNLALTRSCLRSVLSSSIHPNFEVIVVDNASTDGTPEFLNALAAADPRVRVILNGENRGFAAANNQGIAIATGSILVLLNNDTIAPNGWLPRLIHHLRDREVGLVVAATNFSGNESRIPVTYESADGIDAFAAELSRSRDGESFDIAVAAMYCVAMRRDTYETVGALDEQFEVGMFEDDDYSHRVRLAGLRVICAEDAFIHHVGQGSFRKLSAAKYQAIFRRNRRYFEKKWSVKWRPHTLRASGPAPPPHAPASPARAPRPGSRSRS